MALFRSEGRVGLLLGLMLGCFVMPVFSQTVSNCVSAEEVSAMLSSKFRGVPAVTPGGMPAGLQELVPLPSGATVVASASSETWARVAVRVPSKPDQARDLIRAALLSGEWRAAEKGPAQPGGFVYSDSEEVSLCGPDHRLLSVVVHPLQDQTLAVLDILDDDDCWPGSSDRWRLVGDRHYDQFERFLPTLHLPEDSVWIGGGGGGNSGSQGLGDSRSRSNLFKVDMSRVAVARHFGGQMVEQGWLPDAESSGTVSDMQIFQQESPDGQKLVGFLTVVALGDNQYEATIRALRASRPGE